MNTYSCPYLDISNHHAWIKLRTSTESWNSQGSRYLSFYCSKLCIMEIKDHLIIYRDC